MTGAGGRDILISMKNTAAIILAAGKGTRMKSSLPKVLHKVAGVSMLGHTLELLRELRVSKVIVVVEHEEQMIREAFDDKRITFVKQGRTLGTGHAVMRGITKLKGFSGDILILSGDVPLIKKETIKALYKVRGMRGQGKSKGGKVALSFISIIKRSPAGYGRVVRDRYNAVSRIVEHKDCTPLERTINEVNTGHYLVDAKFLFKNIKRLGKNNAQGEYYLPDLVALAVADGLKVKALTHAESTEVMGVNNRVELAMANCLMRLRIVREHMYSGVTVMDPGITYIDATVKVGRDSVIYPAVHLEGSTVIGKNCVIEEGVKIIDSVIGDNSTIKSHTIIESSRAGKGVSIGPLARLRPGNRLGDLVHIGNFVELKNSTIGAGTKAGHLTYLGDAVIGRNVNIGGGTITCNFDGRVIDGKRKHTTRIGDGAFIGSDSQLIAPVKVGKGAYVGAGTTVTRDVPPKALVTSRGDERIRRGWVPKAKPRKRKSKKR